MIWASLSLALTPLSPVVAQSAEKSRVQDILAEHYQTYRDREYFSGIQASIQVGAGPIQTYVVGTLGREPNSPPITPQTLFNIGSITKSFTAALLLIAEKAQKVDLKADFTNYLPEYSRWSGISVTRLLNMSSGLPNYTDSPTMNYRVTQDLGRVWKDTELVDIVYPRQVSVTPPLKSGYFYSNTAYLLSGMILERRFQETYAQLLERYLIKPYGLTQTFYPIPDKPPEVKQRLAQGYSFNNYDNPELLGREVSENNLSWAGAAGGIVANTEDIIRWVKVLFTDSGLLDQGQQRQLRQLVSLQTGKPIAGITPEDPKGFGLGVLQAYRPELGKFWFYQGETIGYRALYLYFPCNQTIVALAVNSAVDDSNDALGKLAEKLYQGILKDSGQNACQS
ncbi:MAG: serine hydrolase [Cyanobacteria bacterium RI_101]|nr:serine hydrolase [Cyanobacteria bacterium RI_101]